MCAVKYFILILTCAHTYDMYLLGKAKSRSRSLHYTAGGTYSVEAQSADEFHSSVL